MKTAYGAMDLGTTPTNSESQKNALAHGAKENKMGRYCETCDDKLNEEERDNCTCCLKTQNLRKEITILKRHLELKDETIEMWKSNYEEILEFAKGLNE